MGAVSLWYKWNWADARQELQRAIEINPSEAGAYLDLGWLNAVAGDFDRGVDFVKKAVSLDPLNLEYNIDLADIYRLSRNYEQARKIAGDMQKLYPDNSEVYWIRGMIEYSEGNGPEAVESFRESVRLSSGDSWSTMHLAMALGAVGEQKEAESLLIKLEQQPEIINGAMLEMVPVYWNLNKKEQALQWLEKAFEWHANWMISLKVGPEWDPLRNEPEFKSVLEAMNFPG